MSKRNKIIYWIATIWLALGMTSTGVVQIMKMEEETKMMEHLGYPSYFLTIIGVWKLFGVVALLLPRYPLIKEWAYSGFFFVSSGAIVSHLFMGDPISESLPATLLLALTIISWYFRPQKLKLS